MAGGREITFLTIKVWNVNTGDCLHTLIGHTGQILRILSVVIVKLEKKIFSNFNIIVFIWNSNQNATFFGINYVFNALD